VRGERRRALADDLGGRPRALGQQRAEAFPGADLLDRPLRAPMRSSARRSAAPSPNRSHGASIRPRSTHSIAQAIVPPAEIVSRPSSSQRPLASRTASGSETPHIGPSAKTFSYSTRICLPPAVL
jgi:hypothetical protein